MRFHPLLAVGSLASLALVACGGDDGGGLKIGQSTPPPSSSAPGTSPAGTTPSGTTAAACPATVPAARSLAADKTATDLHIVNGNAVYRAGSSIVKVDLKTGVRTSLYTSPDLVHSFNDEQNIVTVESPNAPDAILKVLPAGPTSGMDPLKGDGSITVTPTTPWNAGGTYVFASDPTSFYVLADVTDQGDTIYKLDRANPNSMTVLAQLNAPLSDPQLVGADVWFVREAKRVYKVTQTVNMDPGAGGKPPLPGLPGGADTTTAGDPTEVFGIGYADCKLAVGGNHAFCSTGKALEQRDLTGANELTVFDSMKDATPSLLGDALYYGDTVFVRALPSSATDGTKNGIRAIKSNGTTADERLVACGRDAITSIAADALNVVWSEDGKGVFTAPR